MQLNGASARRALPAASPAPEGGESSAELRATIDRLRRDAREKEYALRKKEIELNFKVNIRLRRFPSISDLKIIVNTESEYGKRAKLPAKGEY